MSARDAAELKAKASSSPGLMLAQRREALEKYMKEAQDVSDNGNALDKKLLPFLQEKAQANQALHEVYDGTGGETKQNEFFMVSKRIWVEEIPGVMEKIETVIKGPFVLGDQVVSEGRPKVAQRLY